MEKFHYGENLRKVRIAKRISQEKIALMVGMSQSSYSRLEQRKTIPLETLKKVAKALDVNVTALQPPKIEVLFEMPLFGPNGLSSRIDGRLMTVGGMVVFGGLMAWVSFTSNIVAGFVDGLYGDTQITKAAQMMVGTLMVVYIIFAYRRSVSKEKKQDGKG